MSIHSAANWCATGVHYGTRSAGDFPRWGRCVDHRGADVANFAARHFGEPHRRVLLIGGAGFDPRSLTVANVLGPILRNRLESVLSGCLNGDSG